MPLVSVSGACSRAGKTSLAVTLLRSLAAGSAAAVKFTTTGDVFERCPRGTACAVCDIEVPFRLVTERSLLRQQGTDTDRLAAAGASRVAWCIARQGALRRAWAATRELVDGSPLVVMEGSTIVELARPELHLFVAHPFLSPARWKATSPALLRRAHAVVVNLASGGTRPPADEVMDAIRREAPEADVCVADVTRPLVEWAPDLAARVRALARSIPGAALSPAAAPGAGRA
jgi:hypothetical protein